MSYQFRQAVVSDISYIWDILQAAIARRKADGSNQWQDGYPNPEVVKNDIDKGFGYVLTDGNVIVGYTAILIDDEPEYTNLNGTWLTNESFVVFHRVAIAEEYLRQGLAKRIFQFIQAFAHNKEIYSIKADTNFDNIAMIKIFEKLDYVYCGEVYFRGSPRKAYEKVLIKDDNSQID